MKKKNLEKFVNVSESVLMNEDNSSLPDDTRFYMWDICVWAHIWFKNLFIALV